MATDVERVRELLGESIPAGGTEADTMFTDARIQEVLDENNGDVNEAVAWGWDVKAASYADLVDTAEGTSRRSMGDLHAHALRMASASKGDTNTGGTRIHQIERR